MRRQAWFCEDCDARGYVDYEQGAGVMEVFHAITDDHRDRSPECERPDLIRVQNQAWVES